jgi:hypothetical protein
VEPLPLLIWCDEARRELPVRARGRRLLVDYFATRCCGRSVTIGDLHLRWASAGGDIDPEFLALRAPGELAAYVQRDLVPVLEAARGRIVMRGRGPLRRAAIEVGDGAAWLEFIAGCAPRSVLRH